MAGVVAVPGRCSVCGGRLSAYSRETVCSACQGGDAAAGLPDSVWQDAAVRTALAAIDLSGMLRRIRVLTGWSQERLANQVGISQGMVSKLEAGTGRLQRVDTLIAVLDGLDVPHHLLPSLRRTSSPPGGPRPPAASPFEAPDRILAGIPALAGAADASTAVAVLDSAVRALVDSYEARGPHVLAAEARDLRECLHRLLADRGLRHRTRTDVLRLAGEVSALLAYMAVNAGASLLTSRAYAAEAAVLADEIGDLGLSIWIAGTQSLAHYYAGSYRLADQAAAAGVAQAPQHPQAIRLLVNGRARALGRLHDRTGAETAIRQALDLADRTDLPSGLTSCIAIAEPYSHARILANAVTAQLSLGHTPQVHTLASQIEDLVDSSDSAWSRALVRLDQATACLQGASPDVDHAMDLGQQALRAAAAAPISSVLQRALELHQAASTWHTHPGVQTYADALQVWRAAPAAEALAR